LKQNKNIEELFKDGFDSFEPNAPSGAWNAISNNLSNVGATSVASAKGLTFGISMAVASLVGLVGTNSIIESQETQKENTESHVLINTNNSVKTEDTANYEQTVDVIAEKDEVVRTNIEEIKRASIVSEEQKEAANAVLNEPLEKLVISSMEPKPTAIIEDKIVPIEIKTNVVEKDDAVASHNNEPVTIVKESENSIHRVVDPTEEIAEEKEASKIISFPNVFTPNGDFLNDEFFIETKGMEDFFVRVIDTKGTTIFESNDPNFKWNGLDQFNNNVPEGNYYCVIKALGTDGVSYSKTSLLYIKR
jgi:gliding motility-associated-like protein